MALSTPQVITLPFTAVATGEILLPSLGGPYLFCGNEQTPLICSPLGSGNGNACLARHLSK
jgi:hypothetical protein